jgi:hypothetical protein
MNPDDYAKQLGGEVDINPDVLASDLGGAADAPQLAQPKPDTGTDFFAADENGVAPVARDLLGIGPRPETDSVFGKFFQSTLGSKGLAGVLQLPGRAAASLLTKGATDPLAQSKSDLAGATAAILKKAKEMPDGAPKFQLLQIARDNARIMGMADEELTALHGAQTSPEDALGTTVNALLSLYGGGSPGLATKFLPRLLENAGLGAGFKAADNLIEGADVTDGVGTAAGVGAAIPFAGTMLSRLKTVAGKGLATLGQKIQTSVIRPSIRDIEDGFDTAVLQKYDLGGSLNQTLVKANSLMNDLGARLRAAVKSSDETLDLKAAAEAARKKLVTNAKTFGQNQRIAHILDELDDEVALVAPDGIVDLATAQDVKRQAGTMGSWAYGMPDKDSSAIETVYTTFFRELRETIENTNVGDEVKAINSQLKELIPVHNAVIRRIPVAERNNAVSLTDVMTLIGTAFDPKVAALAVANKASKSGRVGNMLSKAGEALKNPKASATALAKRIFGR